MMKSKFVECVQCEEIFEFTVKEQERCSQMGFDAPRRCHQCRKHKSRDGENDGWKSARGKKRNHRSKGSEDLFY